MKTKFTFSKRVRNSLVLFFLGIFLVVGGCYTIKYVIQPDVVAPNSSFDVKIVAKQTESGEPDPEFENGYGIMGILLPDGWIVKDSIPYSGFGVNQQGYFYNNSGVEAFLKKYETPPTGYHWWGAKSNYVIYIADLDTGFVNLTIFTNDKTGEFKTKYVFGDDNEWRKSSLENLYTIMSPRSDFIPITVESLSSHSGDTWISEDWEVYPNPSNGQITIRQGNFYDSVVMKVYDLNGRVQKSEILRESITQVNLVNLSKGTYILSLDKKGEVKTKRIIIE